MPTDTNDSRLIAVLLAVVGALVVVPILVMGIGMLGAGPAMGGHGAWSDGTAPGWLPLVGGALRLLVLAAVVGVVYLVYRTVVGSDGDGDPVMEELRLAYARGDLSDEEYERRRDALERDT